MSKHAYCILAHNEPMVFKRLISAIDYPDNDIYVHIDRSVGINRFNSVSCKFSHLFFIRKRIKCRWGSYSIVKAELAILKEALTKGDYSYFHLLSGVDLPLKSQSFIHSFFDHTNPGKNYIGFSPIENSSKCIRDRTSYYHYFIHRPDGSRFSSLMIRLSAISISIQNLLHIHRNKASHFFKGPQWFSITKDFCSYLLAKEDKIKHIFRSTRCPDEMFVQSVFADSPFKDTLYLPDKGEFEQCLREIDWERGSPYVWKAEDFPVLRDSNKLFARKFSSQDMIIVNKITTLYKHDAND